MADDSTIALPGFSGTGVLVTGGASGIGLATVLLAARSGADVIVGDTNDRLLAELDAQAQREELSVRTMRVDIGMPADAERLVAAAAEQGNLRGVVNAAAITEEKPALEVTLEYWNKVLAINLTGAFLVAQGAARVMLTQGSGGSIVNVASTAALAGSAGRSPYTASKGAMVSMTKALAREWGQYGIRVNAVSPGAVDTPLRNAQPTKRNTAGALPMGRIGAPLDLALAIGTFLSDLSPWTTGQNLNVNGGSLMH